MVPIMSTRTISEAMRPLGSFPVIAKNSSLKVALDLMTKHRLGLACICDGSSLLAVLTDGDLRRLLLTRQNPLPALLVTDAIEFATPNPSFCSEDSSVQDVIKMMHDKEIWDVPVVDSIGNLVGLVHRHDLS